MSSAGSASLPSASGTMATSAPPTPTGKPKKRKIADAAAAPAAAAPVPGAKKAKAAAPSSAKKAPPVAAPSNSKAKSPAPSSGSKNAKSPAIAAAVSRLSEEQVSKAVAALYKHLEGSKTSLLDDEGGSTMHLQIALNKARARATTSAPAPRRRAVGTQPTRARTARVSTDTARAPRARCKHRCVRVRPQMPKGRDQTLSRKQHKPHILALPHPARTLGECDVVLFTKDPQREYKDKLAAAQVERVKVIGIDKLRKKYVEYEAKRNLCSGHAPPPPHHPNPHPLRPSHRAASTSTR